MPNLPKSETWYAWKELVNGRLLTPWADPMLHEYPFDFLFATPEDAIAYKANDDAAAEEEWILVQINYQPVERA